MQGHALPSAPAMIDIRGTGFRQDAELRAFANTAAAFFRREAPPERVMRWREQGHVDRDIWHRAGETGLLGVAMPTDYGGAGGDIRHDAVLIEQMAVNGVEGFALQLHNGIVAPYILTHGTEAQKRRWLPRLCSGELIAAIAMSEPGAGSDLQAIRTRAVRDGDGYRIDGAKTFISNGQLANFIVVVAKTDPTQGGKGISLLVVETDDAPGFRRGRMLDKIGNDAQDTSELFFDDVFVPAANLIGEVEGQGFRQLMHELPRERLLIALGSVATMEEAIDLTIAHAKDCDVFGGKLFAMQNTQFVLADARAKAAVARVFVDHCVQRALDGTLDMATSAIAKLFASEAEWEAVDACLQLHGGYGNVDEFPIARLFRNSRVRRIYGGSSEIMKLLIARSL